MDEQVETFEQVISILHGKRHDVLEHAETPTSEDSARVRGAPLASGAKAMLVDSRKGELGLFVCSASKKIDFKKVKTLLGKKSQFAKADKLMEVTKCVPGAVPPFGSLFNIKTYCDPSLLAQDSINFNAGLKTKSVVNLAVSDYVQVENPIVTQFTHEDSSNNNDK
mmetsp:Transcript_11480/g.13179  ORF Transcript_11480/g.13179 Transcript_11480/m.13179 type:complete len:166 (+) Transcript_11480:92-589(+)